MKLAGEKIVGRPEKPVQLVRPFAEPIPMSHVGQLRARACVAATFSVLHDGTELSDVERTAMRICYKVWQRLS